MDAYVNPLFSTAGSIPVSALLAAAVCLWRLSLPQMAALALCIAVHELGHLIALKALGAKNIRLGAGLWGLEIGCAPLSLSPWRQCAAALGGPAMGILLWLLLRGSPGGAGQYAARLSLGLALFNLLPLSLLDGGAACFGALLAVFPPRRAEALCFALDIAALTLMGAAALTAALEGGGLSMPLSFICIVISYCGKE